MIGNFAVRKEIRTLTCEERDEKQEANVQFPPRQLIICPLDFSARDGPILGLDVHKESWVVFSMT